MANEVQAATKSEGARAIARLQENLVRIRAARLRIFALRKTVGLISQDMEPPDIPSLASQSDGFFPQIAAIEDALEELTKGLNGDIDAIASAFQ